MNNTKFIFPAITLFTIVAVSSNAVLARGGHGGGHGHSHGHSHLGINIGGGFIGPGFYGDGFGGPGFYGGGFGGPGFYGGYGFGNPFFYPPPYYAYPPVVVAPTTSPVYVQQESAVPVQPQTNYWYYCRSPDGYYPYIQECPNGWLQVVPQPR